MFTNPNPKQTVHPKPNQIIKPFWCTQHTLASNVITLPRPLTASLSLPHRPPRLSARCGRASQSQTRQSSLRRRMPRLRSGRPSRTEHRRSPQDHTVLSFHTKIGPTQQHTTKQPSHSAARRDWNVCTQLVLRLSCYDERIVSHNL